MKLNKKDIIFYFLIVLIIALAIYVIWFTKTEGYKCMLEPLVYGVRNVKTSDDSMFSCTCSAGFSSDSILVTKEGITPWNIISPENLKNLAIGK